MKQIIISRTDNLGDVVLTLPLAGILKSKYPGVKIIFIGKGYTKAIIEACTNIDMFLDKEEVIKDSTLLKNINADVILHVFPDKQIAKAAYHAGIKVRIGTSHRWFHWLYCNKKVSFSRKKSDLHETQLNCKLLEPLGITEIPRLSQFPIYYGFHSKMGLPNSISSLIDSNKTNIIFHPKSKGSAREWPMEYYYALAMKLNSNGFKIFITGTQAEGEVIKKEKGEIFELENVIDLTGKLSLGELISFIDQTQGLLACSTGPLHIGAALGKNVLGIYPPMHPIHPGRWAPIGTKASFFVLSKNCNDCKKTQHCLCIQSIGVNQVFEEISKWTKQV